MGYIIDKLYNGDLQIGKADVYKLDGFFKDIKNQRFLEGGKMVNEYPLLNEMVDAYSELIEDSFKEFMNDTSLSSEYVDGKSELYEKRINLASEGCFYNMIFNVTKLKEIIRKYDLKSMPVHIPTVVQTVPMEGIQQSYLKLALHNENPIYICNYLLVNPPYFIIDGNHRMVSKFRAGQEIIQGYIFHPLHFAEGVIANLFKNFFYVHYNLFITINYITGVCNKDAFKSQLCNLLNKDY